MFLSMVVGDLFIKTLILPDHAVDDREIEARVGYAVRLFLEGIRGASADQPVAMLSGRS